MIKRLLKLPGSDSFTELETQPDNPFTTLQLLEHSKVLLLTTHYDILFTCTYSATLSYVFNCWRGETLISTLSSHSLFSASVSKPLAIIPEKHRAPHVLIITSSGSVVKWDYLNNEIIYKMAGDVGISLVHYFRDILLLAGSVLKGYKISCCEDEDVITPLREIQCTTSGVMLCIITLEDCIFGICRGGIEKYRLEEGDDDSIQHCTKVDVHPITAAISFNQYILTGHDSGEVMMWNEVPGIVRRVTNQARLRYPVQCLLSLNEDYFAFSVGMSVFVIYKYTMDQVYAKCTLAHRDTISSLQQVGMYLVTFCTGGVTRLWLMPNLRKSVRTRPRDTQSLCLVGEMLSPAMTSISSTGGNSILLYGGSEGLLVWRHTKNMLMSAFSKLREQSLAKVPDLEYSSIESCKSFKTCTNSHVLQQN